MTLDNLNIPAGPLKPGVVSNSPQDRAAQRLVDRIAPEPLAAAIDLTERAVLKTLPARQPLPVPVLYPDKPSLKLGLDVHLEFIMAVVQRDHAAPQAPRKFTLEQLLLQVQKWVAEGVSVYAVEESCGFGFVLHRRLVAAGAQSFLITPVALNGQRKTDKLDARALCLRLGAKDESQIGRRHGHEKENRHRTGAATGH